MWACHNYWHNALFYIEKGEYEQALSVFDSQINTRTVKQKELFNLYDSCSLLFRFEMQGVNVGSRWEDIYEVCRPYIDDHFFVFNDVHLIMGCLGAGKKDAAQQMLDTMEEYIRDAKGTTRDVFEKVGQKVCKALVAYNEGDFARAFDLFFPVRYEIHTVAGSNAQRDVFSQFLIMAAMQSPRAEHQRLARALLAERKMLKENSPLTDRLTAKLVTLHDK
nr:hypothetical protein BaRGS_000915 [Batillaria attramentaria]